MDAGAVTKVIPEKARTIVVILIVVVVIGVALYILSKTFGSIGSIIGKIGGAIGGVTDTLGLTTPKEVSDANALSVITDTSSATPGSPWSPLTYITAPNSAVLNPSDTGGTDTGTLAEAIWNAAGIFSTDGNAMYNAIKALSSKAQVSFLCHGFSDAYGKDLWDFISVQMGSNTNRVILGQIVNYVNALPNY